MIKDMVKNLCDSLEKYQQAVKVICVFTILALAVMIFDEINISNETVLERASYDGDSITYEYTYAANGEVADSITVNVNPVAITREQADELMNIACTEFEDNIAGDNESINEVKTDLDFRSEYCNGYVTAVYNSSKDTVINSLGEVDITSISEPELIEITAIFTCGEWSIEDILFVNVIVPEEGSAEWIRWQLLKIVRGQESDTSSKQIVLPEQIGNSNITWTRQNDRRWPILIVLGVFVGVILEWKKADEIRKAKKKRDEQLMMEYPRLIELIALLTGAGMTIRAAWERIIRINSHIEGDITICNHIYVEEMIITYNEISRGVSEIKAYEQFGNRIGLVTYKRFSSILSQNLTKGTKDMNKLLNEEAKEAWIIRRSNALQLGETASTKLLFPMMVMLGMIIGVLVMPAIGMFG